MLPTAWPLIVRPLTSSACNRRCSCLSSSWCAIVSLSSACAACYAIPHPPNTHKYTRYTEQQQLLGSPRGGEKSTTENESGRARVSSGSDLRTGFPHPSFVFVGLSNKCAHAKHDIRAEGENKTNKDSGSDDTLISHANSVIAYIFVSL